MFQNAMANVNPPIGLLNDRKVVNMIETEIGSIVKYEINRLDNII